MNMNPEDDQKCSLDRNCSNESVQVIVRCRPLNDKEIDSKCTSVVNIYSTRGVIEVENPKARNENERKKMFTYDAVYDENSTQQNLFDETVRPLVSSVLEGYNCCVFAYGQTGTGKTFTMEGRGIEDEKGIIPRAFEQIWAHISRQTGVEFLVSVRYMEIYMEEISKQMTLPGKCYIARTAKQWKCTTDLIAERSIFVLDKDCKFSQNTK